MSIPTTTLQYFLPKMGSYSNLVLREATIPELRENEVLVKIHAVCMQFRDLLVVNGQYPLPTADSLVPCSDMAGEVVAVGEGAANQWKPNDRVCANFFLDHVYGPVTPDIPYSALGGAVDGVLTQYRVFPAHSLVKVPEHLSYEEASTLPGAAVTAYNALNGPVPVKAGDYVLVLGTGGVSLSALQFAVAAGATVIVTSSSDEKLEVAAKLGAKYIINYKKTPNWDEEVNKITNGVGVDHVIEVAGGTLPKSIQSARMGSGQIHIIGVVALEDQAPSVVFPLIKKAVTLRGILVGTVSQFKDMNRMISAHPELTRPLIDRVFPFDKAVDAYKYMEAQKHVGRVIIRVA